jgi:DedD protein
MDRGLKERLIGAAVLVALGVWLIPWVLNGPEGDGGAEPEKLQLPAPTESTPLRTQTIHLNEARDPATILPDGPVPAASPVAEPAVSAGGRDGGPVSEIPSPAPPAIPAPAQETVAPERAEGTWFVQVGSFGDAENARRLASRVSTYGFRAQVSVYAAGGREMHRVRVGPEGTRESAEAVASSLSAHGFVAQVVTSD